MDTRFLRWIRVPPSDPNTIDESKSMNRPLIIAKNRWPCSVYERFTHIFVEESNVQTQTQIKNEAFAEKKNYILDLLPTSRLFKKKKKKILLHGRKNSLSVRYSGPYERVIFPSRTSRKANALSSCRQRWPIAIKAHWKRIAFRYTRKSPPPFHYLYHAHVIL